MPVAQTKSNSEIKKVVYAEPADWGPHKDPVNGFAGYENTDTTPSTVTVKFKDGSADQVHAIPAGGTVLYAGGMVHFSA